MKEQPLLYTPEGIKALTAQWEKLKTERNEKVEADEDIDISFLNERIEELEQMIEHAASVKRSGDRVETGAVVRLLDVAFDEETVYTVVNRFEAAPLENKLSDESAVGRALLSKRAGDQISVDSLGETVTYKILSVNDEEA